MKKLLAISLLIFSVMLIGGTSYAHSDVAKHEVTTVAPTGHIAGGVMEYAILDYCNPSVQRVTNFFVVLLPAAEVVNHYTGVTIACANSPPVNSIYGI